MIEHSEKLQRALAQLHDELDEFNAADRVISAADEEGREPRDNEYDSRDRLALEVARSASALVELLDAVIPAAREDEDVDVDVDETEASSVADLAITANRLLAEGEGHRTLVFLPAELNSSGDPEIWAVTDEVDDAIPGMLYVARVAVTGEPYPEDQPHPDTAAIIEWLDEDENEGPAEAARYWAGKDAGNPGHVAYPLMRCEVAAMLRRRRAVADALGNGDTVPAVTGNINWTAVGDHLLS